LLQIIVVFGKGDGGVKSGSSFAHADQDAPCCSGMLDASLRVNAKFGAAYSAKSDLHESFEKSKVGAPLSLPRALHQAS
jgi:hypothetical protein